MTAIAFLSTSPFVQALGWTLLHFLWQGAIIALLLACLLSVLPAHARLRYAAGCAAMALMVVVALTVIAPVYLVEEAVGVEPSVV